MPASRPLVRFTGYGQGGGTTAWALLLISGAAARFPLQAGLEQDAALRVDQRHSAEFVDVVRERLKRAEHRVIRARSSGRSYFDATGGRALAGTASSLKSLRIPASTSAVGAKRRSRLRRPASRPAV